MATCLYGTYFRWSSKPECTDIETNITSLPAGGANLRVAKSLANGNNYNGSAQVLQLERIRLQ